MVPELVGGVFGSSCEDAEESGFQIANGYLGGIAAITTGWKEL